METIFNIGEKVNIEAVIEEINIDKSGIMYKIRFRNFYGKTCEVLVGNDNLKSNISKYQEDMLKEDQLNAET